MEERKTDILQKAKQLLLESPVMKYGIIPERLDEAIANCEIKATDEDFEKEMGYLHIQKYGYVTAFNRSHHCYFRPNAKLHEIIHELLHELSSEFDKDGYRIENGISSNLNNYSQILLNEGMVDYLAAKISGDKTRKEYKIETGIMSRLEPLMQKQSKNPDRMFEVLLQDKNAINEFIIKYSKPETAKKLTNGLEFMSQEKIDLAMSGIEKRFKREHRWGKIKTRINSIFSRKKALPPAMSTKEKQETKTPHQVFMEQYEHDVNIKKILNEMPEQTEIKFEPLENVQTEDKEQE